jgi:hypothetical protein
MSVKPYMRANLARTHPLNGVISRERIRSGYVQAEVIGQWIAKRGAHGGNEGDGDPPGTETGAGIVIDEE